jgi:tetratricopeptide (TPR) repeat protein
MAVDRSLKAKIAESPEQWYAQPNRYDLPGIDTPGSISVEKENRIIYGSANLENKTENDSVSSAPWMRDNPFTKEDVERFNAFSHVDLDINREFNAKVTHKEAAVKAKLAEYGIYEIPNDVKKALYYYRKALYDFYMDEARARAIAPPVSVVGAYKYRGNVEKAERIVDRALERIEIAEKYLDRAVNRNIKGKVRVSVKAAASRTRLNRDHLAGVNLKKDLGLERALTSSHYKYKNGTGTVLMILKKKDGATYQLWYDYYGNGAVYDVKFGKYGGGLESIRADSYEELLTQIRKKMVD